jgi:predicted dehydrogenase
MALNVADCDRMIAACEKAGSKLQIGFMRRFDRSFRELKSRIEAGEIGDVVQLRSVTHGPSVPQPWMLDIHKSNGLLAEINSHDIDTLRWYAGSEFAEVYALAGNFRCGEVKKEYPDFYDTLVMTVRFESGAQGCIDGAASVGYGYDARVEVLGTRGILFAGRIEDSTVVAVTKTGGVRRPSVASWRGLFREAYRAEAESFVQAVAADREPEVTGNDGRMAVKIVNAGNRSILERRLVRLNEV